MQNEEAFVVQRTSSTLTVYFEDPFWIGVFARVSDGKLTACKITFGAEPKDAEVYRFLLDRWNTLSFSPPVRYSDKPAASKNPKRRQREVGKQLQTQGVSTKSQQALKLRHEEGKAARRAKTREQKEAEQERQYALKQQKRKEKHRGR